MSIFRCIDRRFETGEIFIKWDESSDEDWLILIYINKAEYQKALDNLIQNKEIYPLSKGNKVIPKLEKILNIEQI